MFTQKHEVSNDFIAALQLIRESTGAHWGSVTKAINSAEEAGSDDGHEWKSSHNHETTISHLKKHLSSTGHSDIKVEKGHGDTFIHSTHQSGEKMTHTLTTSSKGNEHSHDLYTSVQDNHH